MYLESIQQLPLKYSDCTVGHIETTIPDKQNLLMILLPGIVALELITDSAKISNHFRDLSQSLHTLPFIPLYTKTLSTPVQHY